MNSLDTLRIFLGWSTAINIGILVIATIFISFMRGMMVAMHSKLFGLDEIELSRQYFQYLAQYKIAIFIFNLAPYLALRIMA